jgi:hypothetical protein
VAGAATNLGHRVAYAATPSLDMWLRQPPRGLGVAARASHMAWVATPATPWLGLLAGHPSSSLCGCFRGQAPPLWLLSYMVWCFVLTLSLCIFFNECRVTFLLMGNKTMIFAKTI